MLPIANNYHSLPSLIDDIFGQSWFENVLDGSSTRTLFHLLMFLRIRMNSALRLQLQVSKKMILNLI